MMDSGTLRRPRGAARAGGAALLAGLVPIVAGCTRHEATASTRPLPEVVVVEAVRRDVPETAEPNWTTRALQRVTLQARVRGVPRGDPLRRGLQRQEGPAPLRHRGGAVQGAGGSYQGEARVGRGGAGQGEGVEGEGGRRAQLALDKAQLSLAKVQEQRVRNLFARNAAAKGDLDQAEADLEKWTVQVAADTANFDQLRADYQTNIRSAQADVDSAKANLRDAEINLGYCRVIAPIEGRIGEAKYKVGNLVGSTLATGLTTDLATIQQLDPMGVDIQVSSRYLDRASRLIRQGLPVTTPPRPGGRARQAPQGRHQLHRQHHRPDHVHLPQPRRIANPDGVLLPGQYVKADLTIGMWKGVVVVPEQAVVETQAGSTVYHRGQEGGGPGQPGQGVDHLGGAPRHRLGAGAGPVGDRRGHPARPAEHKVTTKPLAAFARPDARGAVEIVSRVAWPRSPGHVFGASHGHPRMATETRPCHPGADRKASGTTRGYESTHGQFLHRPADLRDRDWRC